MIVIGLTGSIGMGKSTVAAQCARLGAKSLSSDDVVHKLMQPGGRAFSKVSAEFPEAVMDKKIDRKRLGEIVFNDSEKLKKLESILHPLVRDTEEKFARAVRAKGAKIVVFDIPLLFETGGDKRMDLSLVATAPAFIQAQRVLARPNMSREKFSAILRKQMPDAEKRKRADFIIHTGLGKAASMRQIKLMMGMLE
jgi:dephospho-CoA kinase